MASRTTLICDMDNGHADAENTLRFALANQKYRLDLCYEHETELTDYLDRWVDAAQPDNHADEKKPKPNKPNNGRSREENNTIREWARSQGLPVPDRGRIPYAVLTRYEESAR